MLLKKYVSIDIGNQNIKVVFGNADKNNIIINEYEIVKTPQNSIKDGKITNLKSITGLLEEVLKSNGIREKNLILNITGTAVITRDIQIPKSTDEEIEKILEFDAQQYFPVDLENYVMDFKVLEDVKQGETVLSRVLLVAVPAKQVEEYMKLPELLKMKICAIDLPANCVSKFIFPEEFLKGNVAEPSDMLPMEFALIDIGAETTGVCIYSDRKLKFNRILLNGSSEIDRVISEKSNIDYKEAEKRKISADISEGQNMEHGESDGKGVSDEESIKSVISNLVDDVNRLIEFYNSRGLGNKVKKIYITGGGSKLEGLKEYISNYFSLPVAYVESGNKLIYKGKKTQEQFKKDITFLVNAIGAVIRI